MRQGYPNKKQRWTLIYLITKIIHNNTPLFSCCRSETFCSPPLGELTVRRVPFELFIPLVDQVTATVALLVSDAHLAGGSLSISGTAPALHLSHTEPLAEVLFTNFSAQLKRYFSRNFFHCQYLAFLPAVLARQSLSLILSLRVGNPPKLTPRLACDSI